MRLIVKIMTAVLLIIGGLMASIANAVEPLPLPLMKRLDNERYVAELINTEASNGGVGMLAFHDNLGGSFILESDVINLPSVQDEEGNWHKQVTNKHHYTAVKSGQWLVLDKTKEHDKDIKWSTKVFYIWNQGQIDKEFPEQAIIDKKMVEIEKVKRQLEKMQNEVEHLKFNEKKRTEGLGRKKNRIKQEKEGGIEEEVWALRKTVADLQKKLAERPVRTEYLEKSAGHGGGYDLTSDDVQYFVYGEITQEEYERRIAISGKKPPNYQPKNKLKKEEDPSYWTPPQ